jgi:hypothetical protein
MNDIAIPAPDLSRQGKRGERPEGRIRPGSEAHLRLFCLELLETHDPYRPRIMDWPKLDDETRNRLVALPIWDIAVQTEGKAGINVRTFGEKLRAGLLKEAIEMDAFEEGRHKMVLANMVRFYDIKLADEPPYPRPSDPEWAFMVTGYSECIDSFFGFGLFELAKRTGFFPPELVATFEPVMREEGRHILFFVNWVAWWRRNMPFWRRPWFELKVLAVWAFLIWERIGFAGKMENDEQAADYNFTLNGSKDLGVEVTFPELARICLAENDKRLDPYDKRLIRPVFVPNMLRLALRFIRETPPKAAPAAAG